MVCSGDVGSPVAFVSSETPHLPQNLADGGLSTPHWGQHTESPDPHSAQNLFPLGLSVPHFEQCIRRPRCSTRQLVEQRLSLFQIGGIETLGEPIVNLGELFATLLATASIAQ